MRRPPGPKAQGRRELWGCGLASTPVVFIAVVGLVLDDWIVVMKATLLVIVGMVFLVLLGGLIVLGGKFDDWLNDREDP